MKREFALPGTVAKYAPDRRFDIQHYRIAVDLDVPNKRISGSCRIEMTPLADGYQWITLDAVELDIAKVSWNGTALTFSTDGKLLRVDLGKRTATGEAIALEITYSAQPRRVAHRHPLIHQVCEDHAPAAALVTEALHIGHTHVVKNNRIEV